MFLFREIRRSDCTVHCTVIVPCFTWSVQNFQCLIRLLQSSLSVHSDLWKDCRFLLHGLQHRFLYNQNLNPALFELQIFIFSSLWFAKFFFIALVL